MLKKSSISYSQFLSPRKEKIMTNSIEPDSLIDIDFFRRSISIHYEHLYVSQKWHNWFYRALFFGFGCLFLILGIVIYFKTANFACGKFFSNCTNIKHMIEAGCFFLSTIAFFVGYKIHPERDAIRYLVGKVERELHHPVKHLQFEFNAIFDRLSHEWAAHDYIWIKKGSTCS